MMHNINLTNHPKITKLGISAICAISLIIGVVKKDYPELRTSEKGLEIIGNAEGCRRDPYRCPADVLTVGIGSTEASGQLIDPKHKYTDHEIAERWAKDLIIAEKCVIRYGNGNKMPQGAFDAMVSLTFNIGCGKIRHSRLFRLAQAGYTPMLCNEFPRWKYANGKILKGLVARRNKEKALCLGE